MHLQLTALPPKPPLGAQSEGQIEKGLILFLYQKGVARTFQIPVHFSTMTVYQNIGVGAYFGVMNSYEQRTRATADMPITSGEAEVLAQQMLTANLADFTTGEAETFHGYYTLHTLRDGKVKGMLSILLSYWSPHQAFGAY